MLLLVVAALLGALALVERGAHPEVARRARVGAGIFAAAVVAGGIAGFASRLSMYALVVLNGSHDGEDLAHHGAVAGVWTASGTMSLVLQGALIQSNVGGVLYLLVRRLLPGPASLRGLLFGIGLLAIAWSTVLDPEIYEYYRFVPPIVSIALFGALFPLYGVVQAVLGAAFGGERRPRPMVHRGALIAGRVLLLAACAPGLWSVVAAWRAVRAPLLH